MDLESRRKIVEECYLRHGHKVVGWLANRAVPIKTERTREDAVDGAKVWAAAVMELNAAIAKQARSQTG
jgi:hypothetical protein